MTFGIGATDAEPTGERKPFWAKCADCSHCWAVCYLPMDMAVAARTMTHARCPMCGASGKKIRIAKQDDGELREGRPEPSRTGTIEERATAWRASADIGLSSKALWSVMMGEAAPDGDHPHDPDDLGRCIRLLDLIPEWRERLPLMRGLSTYWDALIDNWAAIETAYRDELGKPGGEKTYRMMRSILDPIEDADPSVVRMGIGMSMRFGRPRR